MRKLLVKLGSVRTQRVEIVGQPAGRFQAAVARESSRSSQLFDFGLARSLSGRPGKTRCAGS
jgi:hypothetical protein